MRNFHPLLCCFVIATTVVFLLYPVPVRAGDTLSPEAKVRAVREKFYTVNKAQSLAEHYCELLKILDECKNDPDLAEIRKEILPDWDRYHVFMGANDRKSLDDLYEKLIAYLKEDSYHGVLYCDGFFNKMCQLQPGMTEEQIAPYLQRITAILETSYNERTLN